MASTFRSCTVSRGKRRSSARLPLARAASEWARRRKGRDLCWSGVKRERGLQATYDGYSSGSTRALPVLTADQRTRNYDADTEPFNRKSRIGTDRQCSQWRYRSDGRVISPSLFALRRGSAPDITGSGRLPGCGSVGVSLGFPKLPFFPCRSKFQNVDHKNRRESVSGASTKARSALHKADFGSIRLPQRSAAYRGGFANA